MFRWIVRNLLNSPPVAIGLISMGISLVAVAQTPVAPAQFDPSDVYFQGYLSARSAEELEAQGNFVEAADKLKKARSMFDAVRKYYPKWKPEMVASRYEKNLESEQRIFAKAAEQREKNDHAVAELEGGVKQPTRMIDPAEGVAALNSEAVEIESLTPGVLDVDPIATRRLAEAEAEVKRLRGQQDARPSADRNSPDISRIQDLSRQRDNMQFQLKAAEKNLQDLRGQLAGKPVENEMKALNQRIAGLEQERQAMSMALTQSRSEHTSALAKIATLTADLKVVQQQFADLDRNLKAERNVANSVVAGQRTQLQALEKELQQKNLELGKANETIASLVNELDETKASFGQLKAERDTLLQERVQMDALLKLNEDGRIQDLIQQNIGLAKHLREANEKVDFLNRDNNSAKDDITDAKRDLAIAKSQINRLQVEKREQDGRLAEMEKRLKNEEIALTAGKTSSDPAEVAMLRDIIQKQLRVQERRRQARDLLVAAVKELGAKDERIGQAIDLFDGEEIQLSPDEQRLIAEREVDGEFISPFAQDRATVGRNTTELNRDIEIFERTAEKSFAAGRYLPTRELFQMIVDQHPGHVPALCKLGVVHLKLGDPVAAADAFRRAVELNENNSYAHRMLGLSLYQNGEFPAAEESVKIAVGLAPDDALAYMLLGGIAERLGRADDAESHYKAALSADPNMWQPCFNLSRLSAKKEQLDEARNFYQMALERGALPDPNLEIRIALP